MAGTTSNENGNFVFRDVNPGMYYLEVQYIGYFDRTVNEIMVGPDHPHADVGQVGLKRSVLQSNEVQVTADRLPVKYEIDKKIINVSKDYSNISGTAVDILENVPSMSVDIEGNVSLRGSQSFTVYIDNRPTTLDPNDALQQIPASSIENIEIITNPSAKFDPDGVSGIVNIITKKRMIEGISGIVNTNAGIDKKYGTDALFNYKNGFGNLSVGISYDLKSFGGTSYSDKSFISQAENTRVVSDGESNRIRMRRGINAESLIYLGPRDDISLGLRIGNFRMEHDSRLSFVETSTLHSNEKIYDSRDISSRDFKMIMGSVNYIHTFTSEAELNILGSIARRQGEELTENRVYLPVDSLLSGRNSVEDGPGGWTRFDFNYMYPFNGKGKIEAGYQIRLGRSVDNAYTSEFDSTKVFIRVPEAEHKIGYARNTQALFSTLTRKFGAFGVQAGVRAEYTGRDIDAGGDFDKFTLTRWDIFPSLHTSYNFTKDLSLMANYSRRINRPRGWYFEPFVTWSDAYNARRGNPTLKPEYVDSYELGIQIPFMNSSISLEGYHKRTNNLIERYHEPYTENTLLHSVDNVGTGYSTGLEMMFVLKELKWWEINLTGNIFAYHVEGVILGNAYERESSNWNMRLNNTFNFGRNTRIQVSGNYHSPSVTSQGTEEGHYSTNLGIRHSLMNRKLAMTLQVRDIFGTQKREHNVGGANFTSLTRRQMEAPVMILTLTYNFNNFKSRDRGRDQGGDGGEGFEEEF